MKPIYRLTLIILYALAVISVLIFVTHDKNVAVLNPAGIIASQERELIFIGLILSLIIVIPVYALTIGIIFRYRENNTKAKYTPDWSNNKVLEIIWWTIPSIIIIVLSIITWKSSHDLDPYKAISSNKTAITIDVVALNWKWLFIYPNENIATVNFAEIPNDVPVHFNITSDTVMNSFWVPNLGGQIYAMPGMSTQLNLMANKFGDYTGSSANLSGAGFADMTFDIKSSSLNDFQNWVKLVKQSSNMLNSESYNKLAQPYTDDNKIEKYSSVQNELYDTIIMKYMSPHDQMNQDNNNSMDNMKGM